MYQCCLLYLTFDKIFFSSDNLYHKYSKVGDIPGTDVAADRGRGDIMADVTTSFIVLLAIYFPSVTGRFRL